MGFPTINLAIPEGFDLADGIYAVKVTIGGRRYRGALHFGPIPTFAENEKSLEVFLLDAHDSLAGDTEGDITVETVKYIRPVTKFDTAQKLAAQIKNDVDTIAKILS